MTIVSAYIRSFCRTWSGRTTVRVLLALLIGCTVLTHVGFILRDNSIEGVDSANHLLFSVTWYYQAQDILATHSLSLWHKIARLIRLFTTPVPYSSIYWPNGLNAFCAFFYYFFTPSLLAAKLCMLVFIVILQSAVYALGKHLFCPRTGLLAAYMVFMFPLIFESSRQFQLDFPLTAMIAMTLWLMLKSAGFTRHGASLLAGISLGVSMLIKGQAILYILGPAIYIVAMTRPSRWNTGRNIAIFILASVSIAGLWWGKFLLQLPALFTSHMHGMEKIAASFAGYDYAEKFSLMSLSYYLRAMPLALGIIPLGALIFLIIRGRTMTFTSDRARFFLCWIIPVLALFSLVFTVKSTRFIMPLLPATALLIAAGIMRINNPRVRAGALAIIMLGTGVEFTGRSFGTFNTALENYIRSRPQHTHAFFPYTDYEVQPGNRNIIIPDYARLMRDIAGSDRQINVGIIAAGDLDGLEIAYWLAITDPRMRPIEILHAPELFAADLPTIDFIIYGSHPAYGPVPDWPAGWTLHQLLKRRMPQKTLVLEREHYALWTGLLTQLAERETEFTLIETQTAGDHHASLYRLFQRK